MEQYIKKSDIVSEIERIKKEECPIDTYEGRIKLFYFERFLSFLDTLEMKEVDFEKEFDSYANGILACDIQFEPFTHLHKCAKYFYELGLKAREGE